MWKEKQMQLQISDRCGFDLGCGSDSMTSGALLVMALWQCVSVSLRLACVIERSVCPDPSVAAILADRNLPFSPVVAVRREGF